MKRMSIWFLGCVILVFSFSAFCVLGPKDNSVYGPFRCDACTVTSPMPDPGSRAYIASWISSQRLARHDSFFGIGSGGKIVICNASTCTTYERTDSGDWLGVRQQEITPRPEANGGRGGGSEGRYGGGNGGGGRGASFGGGSAGGGHGVVTVQKPQAADKNSE